MGFSPELVAKRLAQQATAPRTALSLATNKEEQFNKLVELNRSGLAPKEIFTSLRDLIDDCTDEEKGIKLQALKFAAQLQELLQVEDQVKQAPTIVLNITGNNARVNAMLCPNLGSGT